MSERDVGLTSSEGLTPEQEQLALRLYGIGAIRLDFENGWKLASGEVSHIYVNGRLIQSDGEAKMGTLSH